MADMLVTMFGHMLTDGIGVWPIYFDQAASEFRAKMGMQYHEGEGRICCSVDVTLRRPHCSLVDDVAQVGIYPEYKRNHGLNLQGAVLPNDIIADLWAYGGMLSWQLPHEQEWTELQTGIYPSTKPYRGLCLWGHFLRSHVPRKEGTQASGSWPQSESIARKRRHERV
ncbi:unnamed protein product [Discosporangium mesarthrocarpum]